MKEIKIIELFAGVGGFRIGFDKTNKENEQIKYKTVWSNQWEPSTKKQHASEIYVERFGVEGHSNEDISTVKTENIPEFNLLCGGFPCFLEGSTVLTKKGYKTIEEIKVGDYVLTHTNKYKKVLATMDQEVNGYLKLKFYGTEEIKCSINHPFYCIKKENKKYTKKALKTEAKDLIENVHFVGININTKRKKIKYSINDLNLTEKQRKSIKYKKLDLDKNEFYWFVGRYIADGWFLSSKTKKGKKINKVVLCCGHHEIEQVERKLKKLSFSYTKVKEETTYKLIITSVLLVEFLKRFGEYASGKYIDKSFQDLPIKYLKHFVEGYRSGDGSIIKSQQNLHTITTTSKNLALSFQNIIHKVYKIPARISVFKVEEESEILGRKVNQKNTYTIKYRLKQTKYKILVRDGKMWFPIKKKEAVLKQTKVYNIEVEKDNTYTVNNLICYNCQDYSVAKPKNRSKGLEGKKGVLYWDILRIVEEKKNDYIFLENVDRLLTSPSKQKGRDFAVIIKTLIDLNYLVEWRVVNAAEYGMPQKRRRTYIFAYKKGSELYNKLYLKEKISNEKFIKEESLFSKAFPIKKDLGEKIVEVDLSKEVFEISDTFNKNKEYNTPFLNAGFAFKDKAYSIKSTPDYNGNYLTIGDILIDEKEVEEEFYIKEEDIEKWRDPKTAKQIPKVNKKTGISYIYKQGAMSFPEPLDKPSRTIITSEGGKSPSRTTHVIQVNGRFRRLHPIELERLNMFPDNHTEGVSNAKRAFLMGNALVIGVVEKIAKEIDKIYNN